ncbi:MAG: hypothetical protein OXS47_08515 [Chloroflexota bacterium]|nr:hypothetical protein [Chloroflexota bacterium]
MAVIAMIGVGFVAIAAAQDSPSANVEVRVWQSTRDAERLWISARPEGGSWATLGTIPLEMGERNSRETLRYEDIVLSVPVGVASEACAESTRLIESAFADIQVTSCAEGGWGHHGVREIAGFLEWESAIVAWRGTYESCSEDCHPSVALYRVSISFSPEWGGEICTEFLEWLKGETRNVAVYGPCVANAAATYWRDGTSDMSWIIRGSFTTNEGKSYEYRSDPFESLETESVTITYQELGDEVSVVYY